MISARSIIERLPDIPFTYSFGVGRSLIALGLLLTVSIDGAEVLFAPDVSRFPLGRCGNNSLLDFTLFCVVGFETGRWVALIILLSVVLGVFPALTAVPFAYAAWSLQLMLAIPEGGDQLASNLAIIMAPLSLLDWRISQWSPLGTGWSQKNQWHLFSRTVRATSVGVLWLQVAIVYFFAAVEKFAVEEWKEGTALYYWATDPNFGATGFRLQILNFFVESPFFVVALTWGTLLLELLLSAAWFAEPLVKFVLVISGIVLHLGIAYFMGLLSFSVIMVGALIVYLGSDYSLHAKSKQTLVDKRRH